MQEALLDLQLFMVQRPVHMVRRKSKDVRDSS